MAATYASRTRAIEIVAEKTNQSPDIAARMLDSDYRAPRSFSMSERGDGEPHFVEASVHHYADTLRARGRKID